MKTYRFLVTYECCSEHLYRYVSAPRDMRLDRFAYLILSSFDTLGDKSFAFRIFNVDYAQMPLSSNTAFDEPLPTRCQINKLGLRRGSKILLYYDLRIDQTFTAMFLGCEELPDNTVLPRVSMGEGKGILEGVSAPEFIRRAKAIIYSGISDEVYLSPESYSYEDWDIRDYSLEQDNSRLHSRMARMENFYTEGIDIE